MAESASATLPVSSGDWVAQSIQDIFGRGQAGGGRASREESRRRLDRLGAHYDYARDPVTGMVTVTAARTLSAASDAAGPDPLIAEVAQGYLLPARAAIDSIDPTMCVPGGCPDDLGLAARQISGLIDLLQATAPRRRDGVLQAFVYINELIGSGDLVARFEARLDGACEAGGHRTVALEDAVRKVRAARRMLGAFETTYTELTTPSADGTLSAATAIIRRCAPHLAAHVRDLRQCFERYGIGGCELETYEIPIECLMLGGSSFERIAWSEALTTIESEARRLERLCADNRTDTTEAIQNSAYLLRQIANGIDGETIAGHFRLRAEDHEALARRIDRLKTYLGVVLDGVLGSGCGDAGGEALDRAADEPARAE